MNHEKTFAAIDKLRDVEAELHRLKNALEMANAVLDAKLDWQGLTDEELAEFSEAKLGAYDLCLEVEAKLREKNA